MDKKLKNNIDDLLDSLDILDEKKEKLQLEINRSGSELSDENEKVKESLRNLNGQKVSQVNDVKVAQNRKSEIEKKIEQYVARMDQIKSQKDSLSIQIKNVTQRKLSMVKIKTQSESELVRLNNDIKGVLDKENELANKIKESVSLDDIIATTTKYQEAIEDLKVKKQELEEKVNVQNKKFENQNLEISRTEKGIEQYEQELNNHKRQIEKIKQEIEQCTQKLTSSVNDINQKKANINITIENEESLNNKIKEIDKERKQLIATQNKFLSYPKFSALSEKIKERKMLLIGSAVSLSEQSLFNSAYFCEVKKPDFSNPISSQEVSPFLASGFSDNHEILNGLVDKYKKDFSFKEVDTSVYEFRDDTGSLRVLCKLREDTSVWQVLYFGSSMDNEQKVVKVDVYDTLGNIRYTQYPSYDNDSIMGIQEQWFTPKGSVFLISQSFGDSEQFQLLNLGSENGESSIDRIITGINNLFLYWIESVGQNYLVLSDSKSLKLIDKLNIQNMVLYIEHDDADQKKYFDENTAKFKALLCKDLPLAQITFWKNKNTNIWIAK